MATRREFLKQSSAALVGLSIKADRPISGSFVNDAFPAGHRLRDGAAFGPAKRSEKVSVVIIGGGIAGLSAAWRLQKRGFRDFVLLEMNPQAGGNARSGENEITSYPWAAHYVPVPGPKATYVRELMQDLGVLKDGKWEERYLCFAPQERLFLYGRWQDGIEPAVGLTVAERDQFKRMEELIAQNRASGAFTIPMEVGLSERSAELDRISFAEWLRRQGMQSPLFTWYMNYCCRDDYGALASQTSAWAGLHYFASREAADIGPLTWPEGNGWLTKQLLLRVGSHVRTGQVVNRVVPGKRDIRVLAGDTEFRAEAVIFAAPTFLAPYIVEGMPRLHDFEYSPWLTANLTLERIPRSGDAGPAWDNVVLDSPTLGYVDAMHQSVQSHIDRSVWTFYWALAEGSPAQNRQMLLDKSWGYWRDAILNDLERAHPDIRSCVSRIDIMRHGHAMVRPVVGSIFSAERRELARRTDRLLFANSDLSAFSIFEEAQYRGVVAADRALRRIGG